MKKYLRLAAGALAIIAVFMMFFTQVAIKWSTGTWENIGVQALLGGTYKKGTGIEDPVVSGFVGYILLGVGGIIILLCALVPYIKNHDVLSMVLTGLGVVIIIVGIILIFLIRRNFANQVAPVADENTYVGWGAMVGGSLGSLAGLGGILGIVFDLIEK